MPEMVTHGERKSANVNRMGTLPASAEQADDNLIECFRSGELAFTALRLDYTPYLHLLIPNSLPDHIKPDQLVSAMWECVRKLDACATGTFPLLCRDVANHVCARYHLVSMGALPPDNGGDRFGSFIAGKQAFERLYLKHRSRHYWIARRLVFPREPKDPVQKSWLKITKSILEGRYDPRGEFGAWSDSVVERTCLDWVKLRDNTHNQPTIPQDAPDDFVPFGTVVDPHALGAEQISAIENVCAARTTCEKKLGPTSRAVLSLRRQGWRQNRIAIAFQLSPAAIHSRLFASTQYMQRCLPETYRHAFSEILVYDCGRLRPRARPLSDEHRVYIREVHEFVETLPPADSAILDLTAEGWTDNELSELFATVSKPLSSQDVSDWRSNIEGQIRSHLKEKGFDVD